MHLPRGGEANLFLEPAADERVAHEDQPFAQRHTDAVRKFDRRRPRAAFGAVDDDIVEADARFEHRLHDGIDLVRLADAQLDPDRFAARQLAQLRSEEHPSELQSLMRSSYAVFCLHKTTTPYTT